MLYRKCLQESYGILRNPQQVGYLSVLGMSSLVNIVQLNNWLRLLAQKTMLSRYNPLVCRRLCTVFSETRSTKSVKLSNFKWSANDVSRKFQGCKTSDHFIEKYLELFGDAAGEQSTDATTNSQPSKKRIKLSKANNQSHKVLMPVSRNRELQTEEGD